MKLIWTKSYDRDGIVQVRNEILVGTRTAFEFYGTSKILLHRLVSVR